MAQKKYDKLQEDVMKWIWRVHHYSLLLFVLVGGGSGFLSSLLDGALGLNTGEKVELGGRVTDTSDSALLGELLNEGTGNGAIDLELFHEGGAGHNQDLGDFLADLSEALLIKENIGVELVLNLNLGPGLLFGATFLSTSGLLGGLRALSGGLTCVFTTLLLLGLPKIISKNNAHLPWDLYNNNSPTFSFSLHYF